MTSANPDRISATRPPTQVRKFAHQRRQPHQLSLKQDFSFRFDTPKCKSKFIFCHKVPVLLFFGVYKKIVVGKSKRQQDLTSNQYPTLRSYTLYIWGRRERGKNRNITTFTGLFLSPLSEVEGGGERRGCIGPLLSAVYIVPSPPPPPPPQNRSDDDDDSRIKSRFSFFQQNDFISGSLALKDAPSGQGQ